LIKERKETLALSDIKRSRRELKRKRPYDTSKLSDYEWGNEELITKMRRNTYNMGVDEEGLEDFVAL
jgi:hypothetical protein